MRLCATPESIMTITSPNIRSKGRLCADGIATHHMMYFELVSAEIAEKMHT